MSNIRSLDRFTPTTFPHPSPIISQTLRSNTHKLPHELFHLKSQVLLLTLRQLALMGSLYHPKHPSILNHSLDGGQIMLTNLKKLYLVLQIDHR